MGKIDKTIEITNNYKYFKLGQIAMFLTIYVVENA